MEAYFMLLCSNSFDDEVNVNNSRSVKNTEQKQKPTCIICMKELADSSKVISIESQDLISSLIKLLKLENCDIRLNASLTNVTLCPGCSKTISSSKTYILELMKLQEKLNKLVEIVKKHLLSKSSTRFDINKVEIKDQSQLRYKIIAEVKKRDYEANVNDNPEEFCQNLDDSYEYDQDRISESEVSTNIEVTSKKLNGSYQDNEINNLINCDDNLNTPTPEKLNSSSDCEINFNLEDQHLESDNLTPQNNENVAKESPVSSSDKLLLSKGLGTNFSQEEEDALVLQYVKYRNHLRDRKFKGIFKNLVWRKIASDISSSLNLPLRPFQQCSKKLLNIINRERIRLGRKDPDKVYTNETIENLLFSNEKYKVSKETELEVNKFLKKMMKTSTSPSESFKGTNKDLKITLDPTKEKTSNSTSSHEEKTQHSSYLNLNTYILRDLEFKEDVQTSSDHEEYCLGLVNEDPDLKLTERFSVVKEYGIFRSVLESHKNKNIGRNYEKEKHVWSRISEMVNSNSIYNSKSNPYSCFKFIEEINKDSSAHKFLTWKAHTLCREVELKVPVISLAPIETPKKQNPVINSPPIIPSTTQKERMENLKLKYLNRSQISNSHSSKKNTQSKSNLNSNRTRMPRTKCDAEGCSLEFKCKRRLLAHLHTHVESTYYCKFEKCTKKVYRTPLHLQMHMKSAHDEETKKFACELCDKHFSRSYNYKKHKERHEKKSKEKSYACNLCERKFRVKVYLESHLAKVHGDEHPELRPDSFKCKICNTSYSARAYLRIHMMRHNDELAYSCHLCLYKSHTPSHLQVHMSSKHSDARNFICHLCPNTYKTRATLDRHLEKHAGKRKRRYPCDLCDKTYSGSSKLLKHKQIVHFPEIRFICSICGKKFLVRDHWRNHIVTCSKRNNVEADL